MDGARESRGGGCVCHVLREREEGEEEGDEDVDEMHCDCFGCLEV